MESLRRIRNVAIIAHVDHGKSTLADRLIEKTNAVAARNMRAQLLDTLDLERERGITIKLQPIRLQYAHNDQTHTINLIDTPGHVDFSYEVSRTLAAVEGVILLVDATQGVQAQTLAHAEVAVMRGLAIIPVINKIDLPNSDPERVTDELVTLLGVAPTDVIKVSAKLGTNVESLLQAIIARVPPPTGNPDAPVRALVFDSLFDPYRGVIAYVRLVDGVLHARQRFQLLASTAKGELGNLGIFKPERVTVPELSAGLTGWVETGLRDIRQVRVGDTLADAKFDEHIKALPGYAPSEPNVFAAIFPADPGKFGKLKEALERYALNDAAISFEPTNSVALGPGFRIGFLGLLHLEIVQERLKREHGVELVSTAPSVPYHTLDATPKVLQSPTDLPPGSHELKEPWSHVEIVTPAEYLGAILELISTRRGQLTGQEYLNPTRVVVRADVPLSEVIVGFYDRLKSATKGYASLHYTPAGFREGSFARLDILLAGEPSEALTTIVPIQRAQRAARSLAKSLKELVPKQQFAIPIQVAVGGKIIARETVGARHKDVTAKLYGGDITRKRKLLEKQKAGKKKLSSMGRVTLPPSAYLKLLGGDQD